MPLPMKQKLRGVFTPNLVPLDRRGDINEDEFRRYIDWLIAGGVHGLYPNGSTGSGRRSAGWAPRSATSAARRSRR